jgi:hypothetical protein
MTDVAAAIESILDAHLPCPALVVDPGWERVSANEAVYALISDVVPRLLEPPVNVITLTLDPERLAAGHRQPAGVARGPGRQAQARRRDESGSSDFGAPREVTLSELAIEAFCPADEQTRAALQRR